MKRTGLVSLTLIIVGLLITAGCTVTSSGSVSPTAGTNTPVQQSASVATTAAPNAPTTTVSSAFLLFDETINLLTGYQTTYKKYAFEDLGYQYLYPGDMFRISVTADKPVNVLVIGKTDELKFDSVEPQWNTVLKKDQWDYSPLVPAYSQSNVLKKDMTFTVVDKSTYFLIIDPRFASDQAGWKGSRHDEIHVNVKLTKL